VVSSVSCSSVCLQHEFYEALTGEDEEDEDVPDEGGITELYK